MSGAVNYVAGADTLGFLVSALLFLRAWKRTRDALFLAFAAAFVFFGLDQFATYFAGSTGQAEAWVFLPRIAGFLFLIVAIVRKNFGARGR